MRFCCGLLLALCFTQITESTEDPTHAFSETGVPDVVKALYDCLSHLLSVRERNSTNCEGLTEQGHDSGYEQGPPVGLNGKEDNVSQSCLRSFSLPVHFDFACYDYVVKVEVGIASTSANGSVRLSVNATCAAWEESVAVQLRVYKRAIALKTSESCADAESGTVVSLLAQKRGEGSYNLWQRIVLNREELMEGRWVVFENLERHCMQDADSYRMKVTIKNQCAEVNSSSFESEAYLIAVSTSLPNISTPKLNETAVRTTYTQASKRSAHFKLWEYCRLYPFNVSFEEVHLHSVIIPTHYNAGFCRGHCNNPIPPGRAVFHSRLMSMSDSAPNPCCVPVAYQSVLTVQYDASSKVFTLLVLWNMSASQCGCR